MGKFFLSFGNRLIFSKKQNDVRRGLVGLFSNFLIFAGIVFLLEIILIVFGTSNIVFPVTSAIKNFIAGIIF